MRCGVCWVFVIALAVGVGVFLTWEHPKYRGIHPVIKVIDLVEHVMFYIAGAYHGTDRFERYLWEIMQIKIPSGSIGALGWDGVVSEDIELPSLWGRDKDSGYKVQARIYIPERLKSSETEEQLPVLVYYHGGGFVLLSNADFLYDIMARKFATEGNMIILSVNYRLAPEYKFPAALMDSYSAVHWVFNNFNHEYAKYFDRNKVVVAGDSAGSMLSMSVSLLARDRREINGNIAAQVLLYPGTYYNKTTESFIKYGDDAYMLPQGKFTAQWFHDQYFDYKTNHYKLCDEDDTDRDIDLLQPYELEYTSEGFPIVNQPYLNPWAAETLEQIPFTHMIAAEYDLLLDENILLVERLESFGVPTKLTIVPKTAHGFFVLPVLPETIETRALIIETLQEVFQGNTATHMGKINNYATA